MCLCNGPYQDEYRGPQSEINECKNRKHQTLNPKPQTLHRLLTLANGDLNPKPQTLRRLLTLANGDRIPMSPSMKAFFEPENLSNASPATVSRMGIIYVSLSVLGWEPLVPSWLSTRFDRNTLNPTPTLPLNPKPQTLNPKP